RRPACRYLPFRGSLESLTVPRPRPVARPLQGPAVRVGDVDACLLRDADVVMTSWTDAPISWPRGRALDTNGGAWCCSSMTSWPAPSGYSVVAHLVVQQLRRKAVRRLSERSSPRGSRNN